MAVRKKTDLSPKSIKEFYSKYLRAERVPYKYGEPCVWIKENFLRYDGYVLFTYELNGGHKDRTYTHRMSYICFYNEIPLVDGSIETCKPVHHVCGNNWCCNPEHLELVDSNSAHQHGRYLKERKNGRSPIANKILQLTL